MADGTVVKSVNADLREQYEDAIRHKHDPRLISLIKAVLTLTNSPEDNAKMAADAEAAKPKCSHELVNRKTGKCVACGEVPEE